MDSDSDQPGLFGLPCAAWFHFCFLLFHFCILLLPFGIARLHRADFGCTAAGSLLFFQGMIIEEVLVEQKDRKDTNGNGGVGNVENRPEKRKSSPPRNGTQSG